MSLCERAVRADWSTFSIPGLLFPRARLFADRLELTGWHGRGRYRRVIPVGRILQVDVPAADRLVLWLFNGETVRLQLRRARQWKAAIEQQQARLQRER